MLSSSREGISGDAGQARYVLSESTAYFPSPSDPRASIAEFGVHGVIASSRAVQEFFREVPII